MLFVTEETLKACTDLFCFFSMLHPTNCLFLSHFLQCQRAIAHCSPRSAALHHGCKELPQRSNAKSRYTPTTSTVPLVPENKQPQAFKHNTFL